MAPVSRRKNQKRWAEVAEVYFAINLEPRIHFSKSILPENFSDRIPAKRGSVNPSTGSDGLIQIRQKANHSPKG
jgi:hypothetical protein